jgi:beta-lactamase superfamily II metal-dependent hydrolase
MRWLSGLAALLLAATPAAAQDSAQVELVFLDVGQGDAVLVRSPEGRTVLIDAGPRDVVPQLKALGLTTIDVIIASHPHADHIGGMQRVLRAFPVRYYLDDGATHTTQTYKNLMQRLERSNVTYLQATDRTINVGSVTIRILPPPATGSLDNRSVGVVIAFGEFRAILTGDAEQPELDYFSSLGVPDVTVLKAAHHGSDNGVTSDWLLATRPEVVVISAGANNSFGHPHAWALNLYQNAATVYTTAVHGTVTILGARDGSFHVLTAGGAGEAAPPPLSSASAAHAR